MKNVIKLQNYYSPDELRMKICRKMRLPYPDIEQVFRRAVFNYLSGVCDDHDKNFSFIMTLDGAWRLSPAYDVTFTVNLRNKFIGDRHVLSLSGQERRLSHSDILRFAEHGDIRNASSIVEEIIVSHIKSHLP